MSTENPGDRILWRSKPAAGDVWEQWSVGRRSFSRCTGTITIALRNRIKWKLFVSGSLSGFSVAETFCLWSISLVCKLPSCAALLSFHMLRPVQSDRLQQSSKIRCVMPDNDLPNLIYMKTISIWLLLWRSKAESNLLFMNTCIHLLYLSLMAGNQ